VECDYLWLYVIVCEAHNAVWCGRNERETESREREREGSRQRGQCIVKVLYQKRMYVCNYDSNGLNRSYETYTAFKIFISIYL
jgi:hypothetical protein